MPTFSSFEAFGRELDKAAKAEDAAQRRRITLAMAEKGQTIADKHAAQDLGSDRASSGWKRGNPIPLDTHLKLGRNESTLILPKFPGGWTVAEQGRNQGNARGFSGPGINVRTGLTARTKSGAVRKVRVRQAHRWNGVTSGKGTATAANAEMERELPKIAERQYRAVLVKHFDVT